MSEDIMLTPETYEQLERAREAILAFAEAMKPVIEALQEAFRLWLESIRRAFEPLFRYWAMLQLLEWRVRNPFAGWLAKRMPVRWAYRLAWIYWNGDGVIHEN